MYALYFVLCSHSIVWIKVSSRSRTRVYLLFGGVCKNGSGITWSLKLLPESLSSWTRWTYSAIITLASEKSLNCKNSWNTPVARGSKLWSCFETIFVRNSSNFLFCCTSGKSDYSDLVKNDYSSAVKEFWILSSVVIFVRMTSHRRIWIMCATPKTLLKLVQSFPCNAAIAAKPTETARYTWLRWI